MPVDREPAQTSAREPDAVPHDPQDQQAAPDDNETGHETGQEKADHWDVPTPDGDPEDEDSEASHEDVPDTDEAGTGRRGEQQQQLSNHPEPQEPSG
ncbi:hypothetical protein RCO28_15810 [Streptomyces sp. LHD-70]|uniref:hypothetical protein n=1 Tax=Streptomyces sp. LHD-70 TaxID=3072140 RepID=UPI00280D2381|nr:hypothetical protein [Streptomyces sp. LHD-70]MDQ8703949.1 hypothetical protein [Streptomyces sp. LHD-70]